MEEKQCTKCLHTLSIDNFAFKKQRNKHSNQCLRCESMRNIENQYGISIEQYEHLREAQSYSCAICGRHESEVNTRGRSTRKRHRQLVIDHNHHTNKVRGLLCHDCNVMLGNAKDDIARLTSAITYLRTTNG